MTEQALTVMRNQMLFSSDSTDLVCSALATAQGKFENPKRTKTATIKPRDGGQGYSWNYAPLDDIIDAVKGGLAENGLSRHQFLDPDNRVLWTMIRHSSGQWLGTPYPVLHAKQDAQGFAGGVTYARRKGLCLLLGIAEEDDDDGNVATANQASISPVQQQARAARKPKDPAPNVMQPQQEATLQQKVLEPKAVEWEQRLHQMVQNAEPGNAREALRTILDTLRRAWRDLPMDARNQLIPSIEKYTILAEAIDHEHERTHESVQP